MIRTNNIYYAAYLSTEAVTFSGAKVKLDPTYGRTVVLSFAGENAEKEQQIISAYEEEKAVVNVRGYLESLALVRDIVSRTLKGSSGKTDV